MLTPSAAQPQEIRNRTRVVIAIRSTIPRTQNPGISTTLFTTIIVLPGPSLKPLGAEISSPSELANPEAPGCRFLSAGWKSGEYVVGVVEYHVLRGPDHLIIRVAHQESQKQILLGEAPVLDHHPIGEVVLGEKDVVEVDENAALQAGHN